MALGETILHDIDLAVTLLPTVECASPSGSTRKASMTFNPICFRKYGTARLFS